MGAFDITIKLDPRSKKLLSSLRSPSILNLKKGIDKIGVQHRNHIRGIFDRKITRDAELRWKPLSPLTIKYKRKIHGRNKGILIGTGRLRTSFTRRNSPGNISVASRDRGQFGSSIHYAHFHFLGLPNRRISSQKQLNFLKFGVGMFGKELGSKIPLPKRDPVTPNKSVAKGWTKIIESQVKQNMEKKKIKVT